MLIFPLWYIFNSINIVRCFYNQVPLIHYLRESNGRFQSYSQWIRVSKIPPNPAAPEAPNIPDPTDTPPYPIPYPTGAMPYIPVPSTAHVQLHTTRNRTIVNLFISEITKTNPLSKEYYSKKYIQQPFLSGNHHNCHENFDSSNLFSYDWMK